MNFYDPFTAELDPIKSDLVDYEYIGLPSNIRSREPDRTYGRVLSILSSGSVPYPIRLTASVKHMNVF